jgi:hypothetical protein
MHIYTWLLYPIHLLNIPPVGLHGLYGLEIKILDHPCRGFIILSVCKLGIFIVLIISVCLQVASSFFAS